MMAITGLKQRQRHPRQDLPGRGAVDPRRFERLGRQRGKSGEEDEDVEGQRQPEIGDDDRGAGEPDIGEPERPLAAELLGDGIDHAVAVGEHEPPGERADHRRHHQRQRHDRAEETRAGERAMERQRDGEAEHRLEDEARRDDAGSLLQRPSGNRGWRRS